MSPARKRLVLSKKGECGLPPGFYFPISLAELAWTHIHATRGIRFNQAVNAALKDPLSVRVREACEMIITCCCRSGDKSETKTEILEAKIQSFAGKIRDQLQKLMSVPFRLMKLVAQL